MTALVTALTQIPSFQIRGLFATLFAVELREAVARDQREEGAYLWGL
ncbi:MAG: hypothetical protein JWP36_2216 [Paucimonas sp.]|nr:hypothetical protein [Paucimonas sp.]